MGQIVLKKEPRLEAKHQAFVFQAEAVKSVRDFEYAAIFHEQGLGKSKIAIDLMLYWLEKKIIDTVLFVAKKSLLHNWEKELSAHTFMKPVLLSQNRRKNYYAFNSPSRLVLTHYEVFKSEKERLKFFLKARDVGVILDEAAKIKNPKSTLTKTVLDLAPLFKKRVIMTGTPVANRPFDIWAQIWFLDQGKSLGNSFTQFKKNADLTYALVEDKYKRSDFEDKLEGLFSLISKFCVRETKSSGVIELPEKIIKTVITDWENKQYELYQQIRKEMRAIGSVTASLLKIIQRKFYKRLVRLVQVASNPQLVDESYNEFPGKFESLKDIMSEIRDKKEKCIVWSSFTKNVDWLTRELKSYGVCKIHGKLNIERRNKAVESFLSQDDVRVLVATPGAAKEGLTLTVANHVIFYDRTFSLDDYLQAQDRIHRISQEKTCYVYNFLMEDSIDEWVDILLQSKHLAAQLAQGDITIDYYRSQISYDFTTILRDILGID